MYGPPSEKDGLGGTLLDIILDSNPDPKDLVRLIRPVSVWSSRHPWGGTVLRLLERSVLSVDRRLVLLAPPRSAASRSFKNIDTDSNRHQALIRQMQQLRGRIYLDDGAIERRHLSRDGSHRTSEDQKGWHLLILNRQQRVTACVWYLEHANTTGFEKLRVRHNPLARVDGWRDTLWRAVESELARARLGGLRYAEVGGWAVAKESRCTSEGLLLALAAYSLGRLFGGALGMTTATVRHSSSTILRRLGGSHFEFDGIPVPPYFDPGYDCEMELLRFDSRHPNAKYVGIIELLREKLASVLVINRSMDAEAAEYDHPPTPLLEEMAVA
jgi:hypothetical protein